MRPNDNRRDEPRRYHVDRGMGFMHHLWELLFGLARLGIAVAIVLVLIYGSKHGWFQALFKMIDSWGR